MYDNRFACTRSARRNVLITAAFAMVIALGAFGLAPAMAQGDDSSVIRKISGLSDKLELTTNSSRILTLDKNIPRVQVNNPELLAVTPLSATQVQISAKKAGVTQVNLWDDEGGIHTVDVQIYGDARELTVALQTQFPHSSIKVYRYSESLVLTGFVDRPDHVGPIMRLAEDYAPKVINNINVGGVQQILLKVRVMEISRTKLRRLSTDFSFLDSNGSFFSTGVSGLLNNTTNATSGFQSVTDTAGKAAEFGIVSDNAAFFGFIDWVQQNNVAKILAEPNIVAVSGRPAQFNVGGEIPIIVPQSLGTASIEFKPFGTQIDFLPIVLGNGNIRLEVRPRISEIDDSRSVVIQDFVIPALTVRQLDTAVEMKAGQTFALGGLVQERTETLKRGIPYVSDVPVFGVPFRRMADEVNEIELLILVTPEFVDPIDGCEVPCGGPGTFTTSPTDRGLYCSGQMEVPTYCNPRQGLAADVDNGCMNNGGCTSGNGGCPNYGNGGAVGGPTSANTDGTTLPGGTGYDDSPNVPPATPSPTTVEGQPGAAPAPATPPQTDLPPPAKQGAQTMPEDITLPVGADEPANVEPSNAAAQPAAGDAPTSPEQPAAAAPPASALPSQGPLPNGATYYPPMTPNQPAYSAPGGGLGGSSIYTTPRPYSPQRQPVFMRNASRPYNPQPQSGQPAPSQRGNSLIGPVGYDVQ